MTNVRRTKRVSYVVLGLFFLMGGIEYAVILPTLWLYIHNGFHAKEYMLGLLLAGYSFACMLGGPLFGRWSDRSRKPKVILMTCVLFQIVGNIMYCMGLSVWFLLGSRLVNGFGGSGEAVIMAEVARTTTEADRTGVISILISVRQMGLLLGPGLNFFLRLFNFSIGPFLINKYSAPGMFMAVVWAIEGLVVLILYTDLHRIMKMEKKESLLKVNSGLEKHISANPNSQQYDLASNSSQENDLLATVIVTERYTQTLPHEANGDTVREDNLEESGSHALPKITWSFIFKEYVREEIVVIMTLQFNSFFNQVAMETMVTPLSNKLLNWGEIENSLMYCGAAVEIIAVFLLVRFLSKRLKDRTMVLIGLSVMIVSLAWLTYAIPNSKPNTPRETLPKFIVGILLDMFALPFLVVCSISLYSKITSKETQGLSQGLRRSVVGLGTILGPLWAGSSLQWPYIMLGVMLGLLVLSWILFVASYKSLVPISEIKQHPHPKENSSTREKQPLLA